MIELTKIKMTCPACPSQWDAWDEEGNRYYIRYRFGGLSVSKVYNEGTDEMYFEGMYKEMIGGQYDGEMSTEEMLSHTGITLREINEVN